MKTVQDLQSYQTSHLSNIKEEIVNVRQIQSEEFMQLKVHIAQDISSKFREVSTRLDTIQTGVKTNLSSICELVTGLKQEIDTGK